MQLKSKIVLSTVAAALLASITQLQAESYVSVEYLQYDEDNDRISVSAPMLEVSYDINADANVKLNLMTDAISGATPSIKTNGNGGYFKALEELEDSRRAASILLTTRFENRDELYLGFDFSREEDYQSHTGSLDYMHYLDSSHNTAINIGGSFGYNEILVYDGETGASAYDGESGASHVEDSLSYYFQAGITQVLSKKSSMKLSAFVGSDDGYLTNPHGRIVRNYGLTTAKLDVESRPDTRLMYGFVGKYNNQITDKISYVGSYRLYTDDWDITSHTLESDVYAQLTDKITLGLGVRYYTQSAASFYNTNVDAFSNEKYAASDERLSEFDAFTYKANIGFKADETWSYNIGVEYYKQSTDLTATMFTAGIKYKF